MSELTRNKVLQSGVGFMTSSKLGAFASNFPHSIVTYDFGTAVADEAVLTYGQALFRDATNQGASGWVSGQTYTSFIGILPYTNNGIIENGGYAKGGLYNNIPVFEFGKIRVATYSTSEGAIVKGDSIYWDVADKKFTKTSSGNIDMSAVVEVAEGRDENNMILISIKQYV